MKTVRVWFRKTGTARFISHLDLNRCMARAVHKAKIPLWYTEGFNPHAFLTFALPLSLGISGERESMDLRLDDSDMTDEELIRRLNDGLPSDIRVYGVTEPVMKPGQIVSASYVMALELENAEPEGAAEQIAALFQSESLMVPKHTKSGWAEFDLAPHLTETRVSPKKSGVEIRATLPAGSNLNVNPMLLTQAVEKYLHLDFYAQIERIGLYGEDGKIFE